MKRSNRVFLLGAVYCALGFAACRGVPAVKEGDLGSGKYLTILNANVRRDAYEVIREKGYEIEVPDPSHPGVKHITQQFDPKLKRDVFVFHLHLSPDNDPTGPAKDRQRNEMKSWEPSPDYLKGVRGEVVIYRWKFKLPADFAPTSRFTHIHQLKAVGGPDNAAPVITLTPRKKTAGELTMQVVYRGPMINGKDSSNIYLTEVSLDDFLDEWVQAEERVYYGEKPEYKIGITRVKDGKSLLQYEYDAAKWTYKDEFLTIRSGNTFVRPKWGIYRSILDNDKPIEGMKDETLSLADIQLEEEKRD